MNHRTHRTLQLLNIPNVSIRQSLLHPAHFTCDGFSELSQAVRCHCSKILCCACFYLKYSCMNCGRFLEITQSLRKPHSTAHFCITHATWNPEAKSWHFWHRDDFLWLKICLETLNSPGLTVAFCKFLVFNIVKISLKLEDSCDHIFAWGYNELGGRYMIENITQAGCVKGKINIRKRQVSHRDFLRVYNQTHDLEAKSQINTLVTSFASNGLLIIIFLVLCSQEILNIMWPRKFII